MGDRFSLRITCLARINNSMGDKVFRIPRNVVFVVNKFYLTKYLAFEVRVLESGAKIKIFIPREKKPSKFNVPERIQGMKPRAFCAEYRRIRLHGGSFRLFWSKFPLRFFIYLSGCLSLPKFEKQPLCFHKSEGTTLSKFLRRVDLIPK